MKSVMKYITICFLAIAVVCLGCSKDFLNKGIPQDQLTINTFYQTSQELEMATSYLYGQPWFDFNWPFLYEVGDVQAVNMITSVWNTNANSFLNFAVPDNSSDIKYGWSSLYNVIAHCNTTITNIHAITPDSVSMKRTALGEAHFIRAVAYFYLVQIFGPVPIIEDNNKLASDPDVPTNIIPDIYRFIITDLDTAVSKLPPSNIKGHVNRWAAKGLLAKVYLTKAGISGSREQASLDSARKYALDVAVNSGYTLVPKFSDLFLSQNNNGFPEQMFGLQWTADPAAAWGNNDQRQTNIEGDIAIDDVGGGAWGGYRVSADLARLYSEADVRRKATFMRAGDIYPELITANNPNGYSMTDTSSLYIKKYVIGGPLANAGANIRSQVSDIPTYLLRLSDVYLVLAEATLGTAKSTTDADALLYFNKVRSRAELTAPLTSLDFETIFDERRRELAGENQFWFDIKRWHDWDPADATAFVQNQHRNMASYDPARGTYWETSNPDKGDLSIVTGVVPQRWTLSYPAADLTSNPNLSKLPVPYYK